MTNLEFPNEFAAIAYEFLHFNITIALRMHLRDVQIRRRLPCGEAAGHHVRKFSVLEVASAECSSAQASRVKMIEHH